MLVKLNTQILKLNANWPCIEHKLNTMEYLLMLQSDPITFDDHRPRNVDNIPWTMTMNHGAVSILYTIIMQWAVGQTNPRPSPWAKPKSGSVQMFRTKYLVKSSWYQALGSKYSPLALCPKCWVWRTWCSVLGTQYLLQSTWYKALGNKHSVPTT